MRTLNEYTEDIAVIVKLCGDEVYIGFEVEGREMARTLLPATSAEDVAQAILRRVKIIKARTHV